MIKYIKNLMHRINENLKYHEMKMDYEDIEAAKGASHERCTGRGSIERQVVS